MSQAYRNSVAEHFGRLKQSRRLDEALVKGIHLARSNGFLVPVCALHVNDPAVTADVAKWRRENADAFPTQFPVTDQGTARWLSTGILDTPDRMLFFVVDETGSRIGHLGFAHCWNDDEAMEVDAVVRGVRGAHPGIMAEGLKAALDWAERVISPLSIYLRVFSDNERAVGFYERLGFVASGTIPLRRVEDGSCVSYVEEEAGDRSFLRMEYRPARDLGREMILTAGATITANEAWYSLDASRNGTGKHWADYLDRFEEAFAGYLGVRHAIATSSCTGALHIALQALGVGPGDEVIVPDLTWVATANAVLYVGATPVFADVEADSWCLDASSFESKITGRTKAVIAVHLYGHPARMDRIAAIARERGLFLIEDAAPAVGAEFQGRKVGTFGDFAAFSFQGAKLVTAGEGGMLVCNDDALYGKARAIADQGRRPGTFWIETMGLKYKLSNLQAAFGLAQLERVEELIRRKRQIFEWYEEELGNVPGVALNRELPWARSIYWMTSALFEDGLALDRDAIGEELRRRNVDTRPVFPAISEYPIWPTRQGAQPVAKSIARRGINLPSGVWLTRDHVRFVSRSLREILGR